MGTRSHPVVMTMPQYRKRVGRCGGFMFTMCCCFLRVRFGYVCIYNIYVYIYIYIYVYYSYIYIYIVQYVFYNRYCFTS